MVRVSNIAKKVTKATKSAAKSVTSIPKSYSTVWVIVAIFLLAIILFAVFFPGRFNTSNPFVPETFDSYYDGVMENLENSGSGSGKSSADIATTLSSSKPTFVMFKMTGCGHCENMLDDLKAVREELAKNGSVVKAEYLDVTEDSGNLFGPYNVNGFPTLMLFPDGPSKKSTAIKHEGERTKSAMLKFIKDNYNKS